MHKFTASLAAILALGYSVSAAAQISPFVEAQIQAAVVPCNDAVAKVNDLPEDEIQAAAISALPLCYEALGKLDAFEKDNVGGMTPEETGYFYFMGGHVIWLTAGAEAMKNGGVLNQAICTQVQAAQVAWKNVTATPGSDAEAQMSNNQLEKLLVPACAGEANPDQTPEPLEP